MPENDPPASWPEDVRRAATEGEALYIGQLLPGLIQILIMKKLVSADEVINLLDGLLLSLERRREVFPGDKAAIDHARSRAEFLLESLRRQKG